MQTVMETMLWLLFQVGSLDGSFSVGEYYPIMILLKMPGKVARGASKWQSVKFKVRNQETRKSYFSLSPLPPQI